MTFSFGWANRPIENRAWAIRVPRLAPISELPGRRGNAFIDRASS